MPYRTNYGLLVVLWVSLLASNASAQLGGDGPSVELYQSYSRIFILRFDGALLPLDSALMNASLSDELIGRALDTSKLEVLRSELEFVIGTEGGGFVGQTRSLLNTCSLLIRCTEKVDPTDRAILWNSVVKELDKSWQKAQNQAVEIRTQQQTEYRIRLTEKLDAAKAELAKVTIRYIDLQVATGMPTDRIRNVLQNTIDDQRRIKMELIGAEAEREALAKRFASLREATNNAAGENEICRELRAILDLREEALGRLIELYKKGTLAAAGVNKLREAVASAKVDYLKARQEASRAAGGDELAALNRKLAELGMRVAKEKAILKETESQFDELKQQLAEQLRAEVDLNQTKQQLGLLESTVRSLSKQRAQFDIEDEPVQPLTITPWAE